MTRNRKAVISENGKGIEFIHGGKRCLCYPSVVRKGFWFVKIEGGGEGVGTTIWEGIASAKINAKLKAIES